MARSRELLGAGTGAYVLPVKGKFGARAGGEPRCVHAGPNLSHLQLVAPASADARFPAHPHMTPRASAMSAS
jgi:hypothetical protein